MVLVSGVVLLTNKKPDQHKNGPGVPGATSLANIKRVRRRRKAGKVGGDAEEQEGLRTLEEGESPDDAVLWELGEASDEEEEDGEELPEGYKSPLRGVGVSTSLPDVEGERARMMENREDDEHRESVSSDATLAHPPGEAMQYTDDDFGDWGESDGKRRS